MNNLTPQQRKLVYYLGPVAAMSCQRDVALDPLQAEKLCKA